MYGQMTAGSWIYIGTQGILQGTYETLAALGRRHFGGSLAGTLTVTAGLGGMGGAQPLAVTMNEGVALVVEVDPSRIERRAGLALPRRVRRQTRRSRSSGCAPGNRPEKRDRSGSLGNAAEVLPELVRRGVTPDVVTDQTSAHDALTGYVPDRLSLAAADALRASNPAEYERRSVAAMGRHVTAMLEMKRAWRGRV